MLGERRLDYLGSGAHVLELGFRDFRTATLA